MRQWVIFVALLSQVFYVRIDLAQNLVPNSGFELTTACGNSADELNYAFPWNDSTWFGGTTCDLFNLCDSLDTIGEIYDVPINTFGNQLPRSGKNYAGIYTYSTFTPDHSSDYIEIELLDSLRHNQEYCIMFYVSLADNENYANNTIGAYFSLNSNTNNSLLHSIHVPQFTNTTSQLNDKTNWTLVSGSIVATGGERYMTIGNFASNAQSDAYWVPGGIPNPNYWNYSYYFIDDVSVMPVNYNTANCGNDKNVCGDSVHIGAPAISGCIYRWQPTIGLSDSTIAQPLASPSNTTIYVLSLIDTNKATVCSVSHLSMDSVMVSVLPKADAGSDQQICEGYNMQIGTSAEIGVAYEWNPQVYLSDYITAQPFASPPQTMSYVLTVSDSLLSSHCRTSDTVMVGVIPCVNEISVYPNPNNGSFILEYNLSNVNSAAFYIYNVLGQKVFRSPLPTTSSKGERVEINTSFSTGVYFWQVESGEKKIAIGKIVIFD